MGRAGVLAFALLAVCAAPAPAGIVQVENGGTHAVFRAFDGEVNDVVVRFAFAGDGFAGLASHGYTFEDRGVALIPGPGCLPSGLIQVTCRTNGPSRRTHVELGDGDDRGEMHVLSASLSGGPGADRLVTGNQVRATVAGGPGDDTITDLGGTDDVVYYHERTTSVTVDLVSGTGGEEGERDEISGFEGVVGGAGDDLLKGDHRTSLLSGLGGNDELLLEMTPLQKASGDLLGGEGDDLLEVRADPDRQGGRLDGGPGADRLLGGFAVYEQRRASVAVTLDGVANDGEAGEGDNAAESITGVIGGSGPDVIDLTGGAVDGYASGGSGADRIDGTNHADKLYGGDGDDRLSGHGEADFISGEEGDDFLDGGAGADRIHCGPGLDTVVADPLDIFSMHSQCEG